MKQSTLSWNSAQFSLKDVLSFQDIFSNIADNSVIKSEVEKIYQRSHLLKKESTTSQSEQSSPRNAEISQSWCEMFLIVYITISLSFLEYCCGRMYIG